MGFFVPFALGRYTVIAALRHGGMGEILKAQRVEEDGSISTWAIKRPLPTVAEDPELLGLFWKETELMQRLRHPAFARVEEVGVSKGMPFMVMELIRGATLAEILRADESRRGRIRPETWVMMASDLSTAVGEVHHFKRGDQSLIHGDVRAANVMLDVTGGVRLLDFGLALANDRLWRQVNRNRPQALPPFLEAGERRREVDTYAIARLLIKCLGGNNEVFGDKPPIPDMLVDVLRRAIDPSGMYAFKSARSFKWELKSYLVQDRLDQMRSELARAAKAMAE